MTKTPHHQPLRIGLFSDTYHPSMNGIVTVIDIMREELSREGHEVYVFCPTTRSAKAEHEHDDYVVRFPSVKGAFYDDYDLSLFFPPREIRRIKELHLDAIMFFTPGQVGLMGVYAAKKLKIPLVAQYSTDLYEYVEHYPATLPGIAALSAVLPFTIKMDGRDVLDWLRSMRPRRPADWGRKAIERLVTMVHQRCDAVVVLSRKSHKQLSSWEGSEECNFQLIPTGVDALPAPSSDEVAAFRAKYGIGPKDKVLAYIGRISVEKNLEKLIPMMESLLPVVPNTKLLFVGDFEYREVLEEKAAESEAADHIIFTGRLPRHTLGTAYAAADVFVFPSLKDTQGLVIHEAAQAGLPIVIVDGDVTEVVRHGFNGYVCDNDSSQCMAESCAKILVNDGLRREMSAHSRELAAEFTEKKQTKKLVDLLYSIVDNR